jgi:hypothetical protein
LQRPRPYVDDFFNSINLTPDTSANYDGDGPLKQILLEAATYLGDVDLAKKVYALEQKEGYQHDLETSHPNARAHNGPSVLLEKDRTRLSLIHGGLEMFKLVNQIELGIETDEQYRDFFGPDMFMEYIVVASSRKRSNTSLINFLIDLGTPWDANPISFWMQFYYLPFTLLHAPSPEVFQRLNAILGPEATVDRQLYQSLLPKGRYDFPFGSQCWGK